MNRVVFSRKTDEWATPKEFFENLDREFKFTLDPCPLGAEFDGLEIPWIGRVFVNPPYSKIKPFVARGAKAIEDGEADVVVYLVPSRTDTAWFHEFAYGRAELRFIRGRLKFGGTKYNAPFPSMLMIFRREAA